MNDKDIKERAKRVADLIRIKLGELKEKDEDINLPDTVEGVVNERLDKLEEKPFALFGLSKEVWTSIISVVALGLGALGGNIDRLWWSVEKGAALEIRIQKLEEVVFKKALPTQNNKPETKEAKPETPTVHYN